MIPENGLTMNAENDYTLTVNYTGPSARMDTAIDRLKNVIFNMIKRLDEIKPELTHYHKKGSIKPMTAAQDVPKTLLLKTGNRRPDNQHITRTLPGTGRTRL